MIPSAVIVLISFANIDIIPDLYASRGKENDSFFGGKNHRFS
jgi:hypothetical protein